MKKDKINYEDVNEITSTSKKILKILYVLLIVLGIYALTLINKEWKVFGFIWNFIKVISPVFIGILIAYLFNPIITRMTAKKKLNRVAATIIIFAIFILIVYLLLQYLIPLVVREVNELIKYLPTVFDSINGFVNNLLGKLNLEEFKGSNAFDVKTILTSMLNSYTANMPSKVFSLATSFVSKTGTLLLSLIIGFYLCLDFDRASEFLYVFIPKKHRTSTHALFKDISEQIFSFVKGTGLIAILVFAVSAICFGICGLKAAIFFALWNAITNIIPYVGPYIGGIPIIAVAFATDFRLGIIITIVVIAIQLIESYILHPIVMSKTMKLHPVTIILGLLIFGHFFGIIGMVIATPLTAIIKTIWLFIDDKFGLTKKLEGKNQKNEE
ncbi:MAG: AI-2E family transporter [Bacilli bacterium]|nr:AI-2E family transporter [Bacilli bacterium]